ncbi:hypothetical protein [Devosia sp. UYZn731]|uniref:TRAFAC clade GTPase domain-containing protein n=1 Tax=Devosia sp. UYZn731 TaxID=3156345 RepID=UPI00339AF993
MNNEVSQCPYHSGQEADASEGEELLAEPEGNPSFRSSTTLAEDNLSFIMGDRYCTMVGIVGAPDSGKTAALVSLYLKLSHGKLEGFRYADSRSLMALDEISRGARRWAAAPPEQMTAHTELKDDRAAGFLHLRIRSKDDGWPVDFLLPDLPGEWSEAMVDESRHERLAFLERADVIWLMVDGEQLTTPATRQLYLHRTQLYLQRLKEFFPNLPRIILVITRADKGSISQKTTNILLKDAADLGLNVAIQSIASFASVGNPVSPGTGIAELVSMSIGSEKTAYRLWPEAEPPSGDVRAINLSVRGTDL